MNWPAEYPQGLPVVIMFANFGPDGRSASDAGGWLVDTYPSVQLDRFQNEEFYDFQVWRPKVVQSPDGPFLVWPYISMHKVSLPGKDVVVMTAPEPNLKWMSYCNEMLHVLQQLDPELVLLHSSMSGAVPHTRSLPVERFSYDTAIRERFATTNDTDGTLAGIAEVLHQALMSVSIPTVRVKITIPDYIHSTVHPLGMLAHLEEVAYLLEIPLDLEQMHIEAKEWASMADQLAQNEPDIGSHIEALEQAMDASDVNPKGEVIAKEFERYLKGRNENS